MTYRVIYYFTNSDEKIEKVIEIVESSNIIDILDDLYDVIVISDDEESIKPSPLDYVPSDYSTDVLVLFDDKEGVEPSDYAFWLFD